MGKIILTIAFSVIMLNRQNPAAIEGKWLVDKVDISAIKEKLTPQEKEQMKNFLIKPLTNAVFEFKPDHHFYLKPGLANMPKNDSWEFDDVNKVIIIREFNNPISKLMKIAVSEKDGMTFFSMLGSPVVLDVHKL